MTPLRFEEATAKDLHDALRLLDGRLRGTGRELSEGAREILSACSVSLGVSRGQALEASFPGAHDGTVIALLTYDDVADRLRVSDSTVKRLVKSGQLAVVHVGSAARVRPADLEAYINALSCRESA